MPDSIGTPTHVFFALILLFQVSGVIGYRRMKRGENLGGLVERFIYGGMMIAILGLAALAAAQYESMPILWGATEGKIAAGVVYGLVACVTVILAKEKKKDQEALKPVRELYAPRSFPELLLAYGLSAVAGVGEEIAYRAVLFTFVTAASGSIVVGVLVTTVLFIIPHGAQGMKPMLAVGILGLLFQVVFLVTQSLVVVMFIHALYNVGIHTRLYRKERAEARQQQAQSATA